jgi:hypothetical protein
VYLKIKKIIMTTNDRYLNVQFHLLSTEVNITSISRLSGVKHAIKQELSNTLSHVDAPQLQLYTNSNKDQLINTWDSLNSLPQEYFTEGGCCVVIFITPARELSKNDHSTSSHSTFSLTATGMERKRQKTDWQVSTLGQLLYDPNSALFELNSEYLAKTGLPSQKLILYCRPTFHEQFKFLQNRVIDDGVLGWILGPPGTGKSTTALAFASTLDRNTWVITWIHLDRADYPVCVRLEGDSKKSREIYDSNIEELFDILEEVDKSKQHIVFIDGYTLNGRKHIDVQQACYSWLKKDREKRRLVLVCSMSSRFKAKPEKDMMLNLKEFFVYSWMEEEYLEAVRHPDFFNHIKTALDADLPIDSSPEDLVRSKFYFAGASARWMFLFSTNDVIQETDESVFKVSDIIPYIKGTTGDLSDNVRNRLFSSILAQNGIFRRKTSIISRFAAVMLAIKAGPELIRHLAEVTRKNSNPSMDGWMLEMWFFASLRHGGIKLSNKNGTEFQIQAESDIETLDVTSFPTLPENNGVWFKPSKWNQGGFDAIFLEKGKGLVKFVQVTGGDSHSFKIEFFYSFLLALGQSPQSFEVTDVEIFFIVDHKKRSFKLEKPSVLGLLNDFGWEYGKELEKVKVVFIKGWCD